MAEGRQSTFADVLRAEDQGEAGLTAAWSARPDDLQEQVREFLPPGAPLAIPAVTGLKQRVGLALSGGGIRSATFCLGVLQGLARDGKLTGLDYISSVSGGGYIASWLTAWIHRAKAEGGTGYVQEQLQASVAQDLPDAPLPIPAAAGAAAPSAAASAAAAAPPAVRMVEPKEVAWLRRYSNYLAPRLGLLSADSLTLITTWLRNTMLNLVIIVSFFAAALTAAHLPLYVSRAQWEHAVFGLAAIAVAASVILFGFVAINLKHLEDRAAYAGRLDQAGVVRAMVWLFGTIAAVSGALWFFGGPVSAWHALAVTGGALIVVAIFWAGLKASPLTAPGAWQRIPWSTLWQFVLGGAVGLATSALLFWGAHRLWRAIPLAQALTWGPAMFLVAFGIAGSVFIGISGRAYFERSREWWSRVNALLITVGLGWLALFWLALYARPCVDWALAASPSLSKIASAGWLAALLGALKGRPPAKSTVRTKRNIELGLAVLSGIALIGFFLLVAIATDAAVLLAAGVPGETSEATSLERHLELRNQVYEEWPAAAQLAPVAGLFVALVGTCALFAWRVDINKFSLHNMYKNRLVRCYLGASNRERKPQPFTGFDEEDDLDLVALDPQQRPRPLFNAALNLAQGSNLAWQQRKAASFVFGLHACGFELGPTQGDSTESFMSDAAKEPLPAGYRPTDEYADPHRLKPRVVEDRKLGLGSACATSGAAVTPNMGAGTSTIRAFLLTIFNARIGRWCPNPAYPALQQLSPTFGFRWLMQELFGGTNERSRYVYLSDGGHFENLGVYELVRRRCSLIVVVDAAADPERTFDDLGRAIRQCRVDFGAEIRISLDALRARGKLAPEEAYAWGEIVYDGTTETRAVGALLYLKPTMTRRADEPVDVQAYARRDPTFPQQETADQFFDESQFESYRRLGLHIAKRALLDPRSQLLPTT